MRELKKMKSDLDRVISRDNMDFASSLRGWKETNWFNLLVAQPEDAPGKCYNSEESLSFKKEANAAVKSLSPELNLN